jgi:hypothetical protein
VGNLSQANRSLAALSNRSRAFCGRNLQQEADAAAAAAALEAARVAARAAADLERETNEHHEAFRLKQYRRAAMARASAEMQQSPPPAPLAPSVIDPVPSPEAVARAVQHLRSLRQPARPVDPSRSWGGGVTLP